MLDENSIVDRILSGDDSAFDRLVDRYEHKVYQYALHFLGQERDACLATEEIFYRIYRNLDARTDTLLSTWVFRIATNVCADFQHRKRNGRGGGISDTVSRLREPFHKEEHELSDEIRIQLLRLTRQQREVLLLRDLCGLSDEETGQILELDARGVRSRLSRARKNLRELLLQQNALELPGGQPAQRYGTSHDCQSYRELCSQYVDECISESDKVLLLDHIQECTSCAAYLNDLTVIGRSLSHMEEISPPEELREKLISAARRQSEQVQQNRKREFHLPAFTFIVVSAVFLVMISSGALGGLFVNSSQNAWRRADASQTSSQVEVNSCALAAGVDVPDAVTVNSYAFVIAAVGNTELPELSTSATLLAGDEGNGLEYYSVNNDISLVQKLTDGLESVGYELETVSNHQIVISANATQGLFVIVHS